jgi:hypothetical protein
MIGHWTPSFGNWAFLPLLAISVGLVDAVERDLEQLELELDSLA